MTDLFRTHDRLDRALRNQLLKEALTDGMVLPLLLLWILGAVLLVTIFDVPLLVLVWTLMALGFAAVMLLSTLTSTEMRSLALRFALASILAINDLPSESRTGARATIDQLAEIAGLIGRGAGHEERLFVHARQNLFEVVSLQVQLLSDGFYDPSVRTEVSGEVRRVLMNAKGLLGKGVERGTDGSQRIAAALVKDTQKALSDVTLLIENRDREASTEDRPRHFDGRIIDDVPSLLLDLKTTLEEGFRRASFQDGVSALQQLSIQYERLLLLLQRRREADPFALARVPTLAHEAYHQGLSVLGDALEIVEASTPEDRDRLQREIAGLEQSLAGPANADEVDGARRIREERLQSHRARLQSLREQEFRLEELLHQCGRCEVSLERARADIAALKGESSQLAVTDATETLQRTVDLARGVQHEIRRLTLAQVEQEKEGNDA
jgi:hypothetical protein